MDLQLFVLNASYDWGNQVAEQIESIRLAEHEERNFEDGEHKVRPLENVRGRHVFVVQSLYSDDRESVNDKICRLLFFVGALKDASAETVTVVCPYFAYARKDRKTKPRDPITISYMAKILEAVGVDRIMTIDVHNLAAFENAFRIPTEHLEGRVLFAPYFAKIIQDEKVVVVSPDAGGVKRADQFRETLSELLGRDLGRAFLEKKRSAGVVSGGQDIVGDVKDSTAIIIDDIISSGTTIKLTVDALHKKGVKRVFACTTHGLFVGDAASVVSDPKLEKLIITNSIPPFRLSEKLVKEKIEILDATRLFAQAIEHIYSNDSIVNLLSKYPNIN